MSSEPDLLRSFPGAKGAPPSYEKLLVWVDRCFEYFDDAQLRGVELAPTDIERVVDQIWSDLSQRVAVAKQQASQVDIQMNEIEDLTAQVRRSIGEQRTSCDEDFEVGLRVNHEKLELLKSKLRRVNLLASRNRAVRTKLGALIGHVEWHLIRYKDQIEKSAI